MKNTLSKKDKLRLGRIRQGMIQRCYNPNHAHYSYYGGKGIKVCEDWLISLSSFRDWAAANGYESHLTIDRSDSNGDYSPQNCSWKTRLYQAQTSNRNKKNNSSGYTGVSQHVCGKFRSYISVNGRIKHLGLFETKIEAAKAYDSFIVENNLNHSTNGVLN